MDKAPTRKVAGAAWLMTEKKNARQRHICNKQSNSSEMENRVHGVENR